MEMQPTETQNEERLPWHKPEVRRLVVSLDTQFRLNSDTDGQGGTDEG